LLSSGPVLRRNQFFSRAKSGMHLARAFALRGLESHSENHCQCFSLRPVRFRLDTRSIARPGVFLTEGSLGSGFPGMRMRWARLHFLLAQPKEVRMRRRTSESLTNQEQKEEDRENDLTRTNRSIRCVRTELHVARSASVVRSRAVNTCGQGRCTPLGHLLGPRAKWPGSAIAIPSRGHAGRAHLRAA